MFDKKITYQKNKIEELHGELKRWESHIYFIEDEMFFIDNLLNSYVFEPRTPNLFERLELFKQASLQSKEEKEHLKQLISKHENNIGGILECNSSKCDDAYHSKHEKLAKQVANYFENYIKLKADIYNYAGAILKRKKPSQ